MACKYSIDSSSKEALLRKKAVFVAELARQDALFKALDTEYPEGGEIYEEYALSDLEDISETEDCIKYINGLISQWDESGEEPSTTTETTSDSYAESTAYSEPAGPAQPTFDGTETAGSSDTVAPAVPAIPPDWTEEHTQENSGDAKNRISGYDLKSSEDVEKLNSSRGEKQNLDGKNLYTSPWDWRFANAYTVSQSVGNYMPAGPEWVGSPSIMNPYALIRFSHVAGNRHHVNLLDNAGNHLFRTGGLVRKQLTNSDRIAGDTDVPMGVSEISKTKLSEYGLDSGFMQDSTYGTAKSIEQDSNGALYINYENPNRMTWDTQDTSEQLIDGKDGAKSPSVPVEVETDWDAQGAANLENNPGKKEYWLKATGMKECKDPTITVAVGGEIYVQTTSADPCKELAEDFKTASSNDAGASAGAKNNVSTLVRALKSNWVQIEGQIPKYRTWKQVGHPTTKVPLLSDKMLPLDDAPLEPSMDNLCDPANFKGKEQFLYRWPDFLYCTWYEKIPNNYMITLRRFPNPTLDNGAIFGQATTKQFVQPIATAVTWASPDETGNNLAEVLGLGWKINWKDISADVNEVQGNEVGAGAEGSPFGGMSKWLGQMNNISGGSGGGGFGAASGWDEQRARFDPYKSGMYQNRVFGPVNAITKTKARERGIESEHTMTLKFHYALRSEGGINAKAAMLDILANFLALTYNNADFWGGANRYFPNKPQYPFPGGKKGFETWYKGDFEGFLGSMGTQLSQTVGNLGNVLQDLLNNPAGALKQLLGGAGRTWMAEKQAKSRPAILTFKALLTGDPVGEWHVMVGNPFNPIASYGNMIVTGAKVIFGERLGIDDFPTTMDFEVTLEHGRPRDKGDIESVFNRGEGRLHYAPFGQRDNVWNTSSATQNSKIDTSWKKDGTSKPGIGGGYEKSTGGGGSDVEAATTSGSTVSDAGAKQAFKLSRQLGFESGGYKGT